ncbi:hypothetical protein XELAEV_18035504mg [Xenopus laevis]|uniref:Uncharacterized protein n=1 Tax=Xenopus laevis TaxID=8355 RepID=A0A974CH58_XENLA|nr:hypothetical protein XELAEV_18035504mg [Xenopus laevis]
MIKNIYFMHICHSLLPKAIQSNRNLHLKANIDKKSIVYTKQNQTLFYNVNTKLDKETIIKCMLYKILLANSKRMIYLCNIVVRRQTLKLTFSNIFFI